VPTLPPRTTATRETEVRFAVEPAHAQPWLLIWSGRVGGSGPIPDSLPLNLPRSAPFLRGSELALTAIPKIPCSVALGTGCKPLNLRADGGTPNPASGQKSTKFHVFSLFNREITHGTELCRLGEICRAANPPASNGAGRTCGLLANCSWRTARRRTASHSAAPPRPCMRNAAPLFVR
jgi:hypothetical protein